MSFQENQSGDRFFSNPDSFAMAFDEKWKNYRSETDSKELNKEEKVNIIFKQIKDHPFLKDCPEEARKVAEFRIRLLNLK